MLSFWKVMLKSPTFWPFFSTNLSQKHKINFLSSMRLVTVPQKLFPNPKSNFTICEKNWQWLKLVWQKYNCFSIFSNFPLFQQIAQIFLRKSWTLRSKVFVFHCIFSRLISNLLQNRTLAIQISLTDKYVYIYVDKIFENLKTINKSLC